jgi:hypothetical protein
MLRPFCLSLLAPCFWLTAAIAGKSAYRPNFALIMSDGHTELLDTDNMTSEERRRHFLRDGN